MTEIRIKTPAMRRAVTLTKQDGTADLWQAACTGMLPINFRAESLAEAVNTGINVAMQFQKDPNRKPIARKTIPIAQATTPATTQSATTSQTSERKKTEKPIATAAG